MHTTIVHYQKSDFSEIPWLKRLFRGGQLTQVEDLSQTRVIPNSIVICKGLGQLRPELLQSISKTPGIILFHISDEWYLDRLEPYRCFAHVFRNYYHPDLRQAGITQLPLGPSQFLKDHHKIKPATERHFLWSFAGNLASTRRSLVQQLTSVTPNHIHITGASAHSTVPLGPEQYLKLLCDSIFVPCAMGNVNLESFRVYEALDCGAIPIIERRPWFDYFTKLLGPHPLPSVNNWAEARTVIKSLSADPKRLTELQAEIHTWWQKMEMQFAEQVSSIILSTAGRSDRFEFAAYVPTRLRGFGEMLKHHNATALLGRSRLTVQRVFKHRA